MFNILRRWTKRASASASVPDGLRVYAIGDIHGCKKQMAELLSVIDRHRAGYTGRVHLVFLGDMVDRGPDSAAVIQHGMAGTIPADDVTFLMGNHEEIMLDCYDGVAARYSPWLRFGGLETMASYGLSRQAVFSPNFNLSEAMQKAIPPEHISFMRSFQDTLRIGDYLFVHAGIRPGVALEDQVPRDLRWITREFLSDDTDHGFTVVHGHTISPEVVRRRNRIGIDTGCYRTGVLSALVLEGDTTAVLEVRGET